jgi:RNA polymerase sigma-70 factor (ECF subfamily)
MADLSHKERGNKTEHENAGGDKMLPIYLAMLDGEEDKNKFELLYVTYIKLMFYVANRILNDERLAEDAVHQTFLKILENFDKVGEISCHKTKSYIVIMVRNTAINLYNQRKRRTTIPLEDVEYCITTETISVTEDLDHLARAVLKLPVIYKDVLTLKYVQEFSNEEIAKMLDISEAAVRKRLERAKRRLEEILKREESADVN